MCHCVAYTYKCMKKWSEVTQSCLTLCNPMNCSLPGFSVHGDSSGKNTREGCQALLQRIILTQGSNFSLLHLLHWQVGSLPLVPSGKPKVYRLFEWYLAHIWGREERKRQQEKERERQQGESEPSRLLPLFWLWVHFHRVLHFQFKTTWVINLLLNKLPQRGTFLTLEKLTQ